MWTKLKELHNLVEAVIEKQQTDCLAKRHRPDFLSLLKNPVSFAKFGRVAIFFCVYFFFVGV